VLSANFANLNAEPSLATEHFGPLTARQHERLRSRNKRVNWRGIFQSGISIERVVEAKLAAKWQSIAHWRRDAATIAQETAAGVRAGR